MRRAESGQRIYVNTWWRRGWLLGLACLPTTVLASATPLVVNATTATASSLSCSSGSTTGANCLASATGPGASSPFGLSPAQIKAAYNWPAKATVGAGQTIAIVDARD